MVFPEKKTKKNLNIPVRRVLHRIPDCMPHVLVLDHNWASNWRCMFAEVAAAVEYSSLMLIAFEWLELCSADRSFAHISVAMDSGYYCIVAGNLNIIRKKHTENTQQRTSESERERRKR